MSGKAIMGNLEANKMITGPGFGSRKAIEGSGAPQVNGLALFSTPHSFGSSGVTSKMAALKYK